MQQERLTKQPSRHRGKGNARGQSLVEFALVLPLLLILVFGVIDFGMGLRSYISLTNAVREGARFAAVGNPAGTYPTDCDGATSTSVVGRVCTALGDGNLNNVQSVTVTYPDGVAPGNRVVVSAQYEYTYITPLGDLLNFFTGGNFPESLSLQATTDMRLE